MQDRQHRVNSLCFFISNGEVLCTKHFNCFWELCYRGVPLLWTSVLRVLIHKIWTFSAVLHQLHVINVPDEQARNINLATITMYVVTATLRCDGLESTVTQMSSTWSSAPAEAKTVESWGCHSTDVMGAEWCLNKAATSPLWMCGCVDGGREDETRYIMLPVTSQSSILHP